MTIEFSEPGILLGAFLAAPQKLNNTDVNNVGSFFNLGGDYDGIMTWHFKNCERNLPANLNAYVTEHPVGESNYFRATKDLSLPTDHLGSLLLVACTANNNEIRNSAVNRLSQFAPICLGEQLYTDTDSALWLTVSEILEELAINAEVLEFKCSALNDLPLPKSPRDLAQNLCSPFFSGVAISRNFLENTAVSLQTPMGFGSRIDLMENLIVNTLKFEQFTAFLETITEYIETTYKFAESSRLLKGCFWPERKKRTIKYLAEITQRHALSH